MNVRAMNMQAVRTRVERLAATVAAASGGVDIVALIRRGRQRRAAERAARLASGEPEPVLTFEEQRVRARAFRDRMRALGILPPRRNSEGER